MAKMTIDDLKRIKEDTIKQMSLRYSDAPIKITVHMDDCGIAAGARDVMSALMEKINEAGRPEIQVFAAGCKGKCSDEPIVTVDMQGSEPIEYKQMTPDKMRQVFEEAILAQLS